MSALSFRLVASLLGRHGPRGSPSSGVRLYSSTDLPVRVGSSADAPVLVQFKERSWGANFKIPKASIKELTGVAPPTMAVIREPFASFDQAATPVSKILRSLGGSLMAVNSAVAQPQTQVVVDEYATSYCGNNYKVHTMATDLLTYLHRHEIKVALVPDVSTAESTTAAAGISQGISQSSNRVLMVSPTAFGFNEQAAQDNSFMHVAAKPGEGSTLTRQVLKEYAGLFHQLNEIQGVKVDLFEHGLQHGTPDACFPNNWFSTHPKGEAAGGLKENTMVLYPMKHPNRAAERRGQIIEVLKEARGYKNVYDMSGAEADKKYFEGTGVLVLDRINGVAYVNISERAHPDLAKEWVDKMGYNDLVTFRSNDLRNKAVYHTNVMMAVGTGVAIVCGESVTDEKERKRLLGALRKTHEVVDISLKQMDHLCGNALEVMSREGHPVMAMSTQAYNNFTEDQLKAIRRHVADICHAPIDTLEKVGGGGVRCTLAEVF